MARILLIFGVLFTALNPTKVDSALMFDCSDIKENDEPVLEISEVELVGHAVVEYRNTFGPLRFSAEYDGKPTEYLKSFFRQVKGQGHNNTSALILNKVLDLEYLHLAFEPLQQLPRQDINNVTFQLQVTCIDDRQIARTHTLDVHVESVNEFYPQFIGAPFSVKVPEEYPFYASYEKGCSDKCGQCSSRLPKGGESPLSADKSSLQVGATIVDLSSKAVDMDVGQSTLTFHLSPYIISEFDGRRFVLADETDEGQIRLATPLDFESFKVKGRTYFFLNVTVTDDGGFTSVTSVNVTVTDADDQGIQFLYPQCTRPCEHVTYTVYTNESYVGQLDVSPVDIEAEDLDTLNDSVIYTIVSPDVDFFGIDKYSGILYKTNPLVNDSYSFNLSLTIRAEEESNPKHFLNTDVIVYLSDRMHNMGFEENMAVNFTLDSYFCETVYLC